MELSSMAEHYLHLILVFPFTSIEIHELFVNQVEALGILLLSMVILSLLSTSFCAL
jgi:hypothetical protein